MARFEGAMETGEWDEEDRITENAQDFSIDFEIGDGTEDAIHASMRKDVEHLERLGVTSDTPQVEADSQCLDGDLDFESTGEQNTVGNSIVVSAGNDNVMPATINHVRADTQLASYSDREIDMIEQLKLALPGLPMRRIVKIVKVYNSTLGTPSMLSLLPILRETMPDHLSVKWLRKVNRQNAEFVLQKAIENGTVDRPILDTMLQVKSTSGALDGTIEFYEEQYRKQKMVSRLPLSFCMNSVN
jgi:hypothetical protein